MQPPFPGAVLAAVLDIGKSNAKLSVIDMRDGREVFAERRPNTPRTGGPLLELDIEGLERWMRGALAHAPDREKIGAIVPVAHGASCVMLDQGGNVLLAPDYEDPRLADNPGYEALRDPFALTLSPSLPLGLNMGRQIHYAATRLPELFAAVRWILPYPQYWAWRLSGVLASEVTSLGCHTDLWVPTTSRFSPMANLSGWAQRFAPLRLAGDVLGTLTPAMAAATGLDPRCVVLCGIHDSNASYLQHRVQRQRTEPFAVVSSGTWTVLLANGVDPARLHQDRDMLGNVDAFGELVGTARFMGGREYAVITGGDMSVPTSTAVDSVLRGGAMAIPSFAPAGPFSGRAGSVVDAGDRSPVERAALATLYVALLTDHALDALGARGDLIIEGPLAENPIFPALVAALGTQRRVYPGDGRSGTIGGALALLGCDPKPRAGLSPVMPHACADLLPYRDNWRRLVLV
ncbi:hypothetical protein HN018_18155 [Lichenicola cladoniae]|uniref:Carbohydrate kinase FGGY C-terminal domain-containing protein n=1 Tax=Lichenicola cladoniae TaxID=1484109 RepID=A0A6M8HU50_9PROT|nr:hypothetical protein [Lichenicola cladoniae]NPD67775.1 hypothetical protein [Acetobacteraceae bacterium]QKE91697.1 hypothetical protein HN018_18155 [Lichenicola cladoniae]